MPKLTFFRQCRVDGGVRTGIELDGETVWQYFVEGGRETDPSLEWYIDVRCDGIALPSQPEAVPQWLLDHEDVIAEALNGVAEEIQLGVDGDYFPLLRNADGAPNGTAIVIACYAIRRLMGREIGNALRDLARFWRKYIEQLSAPLPSG